MKISRFGTLGLLCFLLLSLGLSACMRSYNISTPQKLGKTVVKILKNQDQAGLSMIIPQEKDLESFLATADMPEDELAAFKQEMKLIIEEFHNAAIKSFQQTSDAASREGVVLRKTKIGDIQVETRPGPDNELADIEIGLSYADQKYLLKIPSAGKVVSGWVLGVDGFGWEVVKE